MLAAFLASLVEFVEALTIILAVGTVRGWRPALTGAGLAAALLLVLILLFRPLLADSKVRLLRSRTGRPFGPADWGMNGCPAFKT